MGKKYVPVVKASKNYKIFVDDIKACHRISKSRKRPAIPHYNEESFYKMGSVSPITIGDS